MKNAPLRTIALLAFAFSAMNASAQPTQSEFTDATSLISSKTRAEVRQELAQAKATGSFTQVDGLTPSLVLQPTAMSRGQVVNELAQFKKAARGQAIDATSL